MQLHRLDPGDAETVCACLDVFLRDHLRWWSAAIESEPWSPDKIRRHLEERDDVGRQWRELVNAAEHADSFVRVAREAAAPHRRLGAIYAEVKTDRYLGGPLGVVSWIYCDPCARGQGVGRLLMEAATSWMAWRGVIAREVFVTAQNPGAVALYERFGFRSIDHRMLAGPPASEP